MINTEQIVKYCNEDISKIENYEKAINSEEKYVVHHKGGLIYSRKELIEHSLYYHRPAKELILLTDSEHKRLHQIGDRNNFYGRHHDDNFFEKVYKSVAQYDLDNNLIREYKSMTEATNYGFERPHISECCAGKRKSHKGYIWKYIN